MSQLRSIQVHPGTVLTVPKASYVGDQEDVKLGSIFPPSLSCGEYQSATGEQEPSMEKTAEL